MAHASDTPELRRLQAILDNPHTSTSTYRETWHRMQQLRFDARREQARYDAQIEHLQRSVRTFVDGRGYVVHSATLGR